MKSTLFTARIPSGIWWHSLHGLKEMLHQKRIDLMLVRILLVLLAKESDKLFRFTRNFTIRILQCSCSICHQQKELFLNRTALHYLESIRISQIGQLNLNTQDNWHHRVFTRESLRIQKLIGHHNKNTNSPYVSRRCLLGKGWKRKMQLQWNSYQSNNNRNNLWKLANKLDCCL